MNRKTAVLAAAVLTVGSVSPIDVSAQDSPAVCINAGYGAECETAEIELNIKNNTGMSAFSIEVNYDPRVLYFLDAQQGDALDGGTFYCNSDYSDNTVRLVWSDSRNQTADGTAAVLKFRPAFGSAETDTPVTIGYSLIADDLSEAEFEKSDDKLKIAWEINRGDVNDDGTVCVSDVVALNMYILDGDEDAISYTCQANAEVTGDKAVTSADSAMLMNYVCMIIKEL